MAKDDGWYRRIPGNLLGAAILRQKFGGVNSCLARCLARAVWQLGKLQSRVIRFIQTFAGQSNTDIHAAAAWKKSAATLPKHSDQMTDSEKTPLKAMLYKQLTTHRHDGQNYQRPHRDEPMQNKLHKDTGA